MDNDNILDYNTIMDESQRLRRRIYPKDDSGWIPNGSYVVLRENGQLHMKITYREGVLHGPYLDYWLNGKVACEGQYYDGKQDGVWHYYNENGTIHAIIQFQDGKVSEDNLYSYDAEGNLIDITQAKKKRGREKKRGRD